MGQAICLQCGAIKQRPYVACPQCGFDPSGDEEALVRSVYLSTGRFHDDEAEQERYANQLKDVSELIRRGEEPEFDPAELSRLRQQYHDVRSVTLRAVFWSLLIGEWKAWLFLAVSVLTGLVILLISL